VKKEILLLVLLISIVLAGCSANPRSDQQASVQQTDIKKLEQKIAELEKENADLRAKLEANTAAKVSEDDNGDNEKNKKEDKQKKTASIIQVGDTIKTDRAEITIKKVEFSYDILPDDIGSFYTHYPADSGNVYIHIDTDVKNVQKQNLGADEIMKIEADYNDGYTYTSSPVPEDSTTGFTYASITSIKPLESLGVRFLIDCPQEVEESEKSLTLTFMVDKEEFIYEMR
jgi:outer membrane murein-binding lipoprotein Lpp